MEAVRLFERLLLAALAGSGSALAQGPPVHSLPDLGGIIVGSGPSSASLDLYHVPEPGTLPASLVVPGPLDFLPFERTGGLGMDRFDASRPRRAVTDDGLVRVELPNGGSAFHYRRNGPSPTFGWLLVRPDGEARVLLERPGTGAGGAQDPFHVWIAASRDGSLLAVATRLAAGGDVFFLSGSGFPFAGGEPSIEVVAPSPLDVDPESLTFAEGALFLTAANALYRVDTVGPATLLAVFLPPSNGTPPAFVEPEIAVSDDGSTVVVLAGPAEKVVDLYVVTAAGAATNRTQSTGEYEPPGYLPAETRGPFLVLAPDGSRVMYIEDIAGSNELFLLETSAGLPVQVTGDAWFDVSIDHPGTLGAVLPPAGDVVFVAGPLATGENSDVYAASLAAGTLTVQNLSATGGTTLPFPNQSTLDVVDAFRIAGSTHLLVVVGTPSGEDLLSVGPFGMTTLLSAAGPLGPLVGPAAGRVVFEATPVGGFPTVFVLDGSGGVPSLLPLLAAPFAGISFVALTPSRSGSEIAAVASFGPGLDVGLRLAVPSGAASILFPAPASFARGFAWTPAGDLAYSAALSPPGPFFPLFEILPGLPLPMSVPPGAVFFAR